MFGRQEFNKKTSTKERIKATTSVCVAKAVNAQGTFVVARYEPGGNFVNMMTTQVDGAGPLDGNYVGTPHNGN